MPDHAFSVALNARFAAAQHRSPMTRKRLTAIVAAKTDYAPETVRRHLNGKAIPATRERALAYAHAFGEGENGSLMKAYTRERAERDVADVQAHLGKLATLAILAATATLSIGICASAPGRCHVLMAADYVVDKVGGEAIGL